MFGNNKDKQRNNIKTIKKPDLRKLLTKRNFRNNIINIDILE